MKLAITEKPVGPVQRDMPTPTSATRPKAGWPSSFTDHHLKSSFSLANSTTAVLKSSGCAVISFCKHPKCFAPSPRPKKWRGRELLSYNN